MSARGGVLGTDYHGFELLIATCVSLSVPVWLAVLLSFSELDALAAAPAIGVDDEVAVKVRPVMDLDYPLLKKGGKKVKYKIPDMWKEAEPRPDKPTSAPKRQAHVSTEAKDDVDDIPDASDLEVSDAGEAPPPDAEVSDDPDASTEVVDPDAGVADEGSGGGDPEGSEFGNSTIIKNRAAQLYKGRIYGFLYQGWPGTCPAGTPPDCKGTVSYTISGLTVSAVSPGGCGFGPFDAQVNAHASGKVGQSIPPPPENHPDLAPSNFTVTYGCK